MAEEKYSIQAVKKALKILKLLNCESKDMTLSEISKLMGLGKSSTLRLLCTLKEEDYVSYDENTKKYSLGLELMRLGVCKFYTMDWRGAAIQNLRKLSDETGLISYLAIQNQYDLLFVDKIFPQNVPDWAQIMVQPGAVGSLYSNGIGRLFLSQLKENELDDYFAKVELKKFTPNTIVDEKELRSIIKEARENQVSYNVGENEDYIASICAPIYNCLGVMIAGISAGGMQDVICSEKRPYLLDRVKKTAEKISREIGYEKTCSKYPDCRFR
ncbi:MAG: IclR family transcriptional regulator [Oscillospiraceae bacterium]